MDGSSEKETVLLIREQNIGHYNKLTIQVTDSRCTSGSRSCNKIGVAFISVDYWLSYKNGLKALQIRTFGVCILM